METINTGLNSFKDLSEFVIKSELGSGAFSKVFKATHVNSQKDYALKIIDLSTVSKSDEKNIEQELFIYLTIPKHSSIIILFGYFKDVQTNQFVMVLELCPLGSLTKYALSRRLQPYSKLKYLRQICLGIQQFHRLNICNRDIKSENIVLDCSGNAKLCDFSWAAEVSDEDFCRKQAGTYQFMSPECLLGLQQGTATDIWSLGVLTYELWYNKELFGGTFEEIKEKILTRNDENISHQVQTENDHIDVFVAELLRHDPLKRPTITQILDNSIFKKLFMQGYRDPVNDLIEINRIHFRKIRLFGSIIKMTSKASIDDTPKERSKFTESQKTIDEKIKSREVQKKLVYFPEVQANEVKQPSLREIQLNNLKVVVQDSKTPELDKRGFREQGIRFQDSRTKSMSTGINVLGNNNSYFIDIHKNSYNEPPSKVTKISLSSYNEQQPEKNYILEPQVKNPQVQGFTNPINPSYIMSQQKLSESLPQPVKPIPLRPCSAYIELDKSTTNSLVQKNENDVSPVAIKEIKSGFLEQLKGNVKISDGKNTGFKPRFTAPEKSKVSNKMICSLYKSIDSKNKTFKSQQLAFPSSVLGEKSILSRKIDALKKNENLNLIFRPKEHKPFKSKVNTQSFVTSGSNQQTNIYTSLPIKSESKDEPVNSLKINLYDQKGNSQNPAGNKISKVVYHKSERSVVTNSDKHCCNFKNHQSLLSNLEYNLNVNTSQNAETDKVKQSIHSRVTFKDSLNDQIYVASNLDSKIERENLLNIYTGVKEDKANEDNNLLTKISKETLNSIKTIDRVSISRCQSQNAIAKRVRRISIDQNSNFRD